MDRRQAAGIALALLSACAFGSGPLFAKPVYALGVDWHVLMAWRFLLGGTLAWAWLVLGADRRAGLRRLSRRTVLVALALGLLYTGNSGTYFAGLETVPASLAALIVYVYPALVAVLTLRFGRRLEGRRAWAGLGLALAGVGLSVGGIPSGTVDPVGLALVVASPVIYAIWIVLSARLSGERRDSEVSAGTEAAVATTLMMTATAAAFWLSALAIGRPVLPGQIPPEAWFGIAGVGVVATFVAIQAFYAATQRVGAAQASLVSTVEPIYTIVLASILLGEVLTPVQLVGGALIIAGVVLAQSTSSVVQALRPTVRLADE